MDGSNNVTLRPVASDLEVLLTFHELFKQRISMWHFEKCVEEMYYCEDVNGDLIKIRSDEEVKNLIRSRELEASQRRFDNRIKSLKKKIYHDVIPDDVYRRELFLREMRDSKIKTKEVTVKSEESINSWRCIRDRLIELGRERNLRYPTSRSRIFQMREKFQKDFGAEFMADGSFRYKNPNATMVKFWNYIDRYSVDSCKQLLRLLNGHDQTSAMIVWLKCFLQKMVRSDMALDAFQVADMQEQTNYNLIPQLLERILDHEPISFLVNGWDKNRTTHVERIVRMHPYLLKTYNGRWYLIGAVKDEHINTDIVYYSGLSTVMISNIVVNPFVKGQRVDTICRWKDEEGNLMRYRSITEHLGDDVNLADYYINAIGVNVKADEQPIDVILRFDKYRYEFVRSKPIVPSMLEVKPQSQKYGKYYHPERPTVVLSTYDTNELYQQILSFGPHCEVIAPASLRDKFIAKVEEMYKMYGLHEKNDD